MIKTIVPVVPVTKIEPTLEVLAKVGFTLHEQVLDQAAQGDEPAYKGRMLTYNRSSAPLTNSGRTQS